MVVWVEHMHFKLKTWHTRGDDLVLGHKSVWNSECSLWALEWWDRERATVIFSTASITATVGEALITNSSLHAKAPHTQSWTILFSPFNKALCWYGLGSVWMVLPLCILQHLRTNSTWQLRLWLHYLVSNLGFFAFNVTTTCILTSSNYICKISVLMYTWSLLLMLKTQSVIQVYTISLESLKSTEVALPLVFNVKSNLLANIQGNEWSV